MIGTLEECVGAEALAYQIDQRFPVLFMCATFLRIGSCRLFFLPTPNADERGLLTTL